MRFRVGDERDGHTYIHTYIHTYLFADKTHSGKGDDGLGGSAHESQRHAVRSLTQKLHHDEQRHHSKVLQQQHPEARFPVPERRWMVVHGVRFRIRVW